MNEVDFKNQLAFVLSSEEQNCRGELARLRIQSLDEELPSFSRGTLYALELCKNVERPEQLQDLIFRSKQAVDEWSYVLSQEKREKRELLTYMWLGGINTELENVARRIPKEFWRQ